MHTRGGISEPHPISEIQDRKGHSISDRTTLWVFAGFAIFYALTSKGHTGSNEHIRLAWALLHGHAYIDDTPVWEMARFGGHAYTLHPPLSAFICLPFVAIWGLATNQCAIAVLVGATACALSYRLTRSLWLTLFFGVGTVFWYETSLGACWGLCLILSCIPTFAALILIDDEANPYHIGVWAGIAALARYDLALVIPIYALWRKDWRVIIGALPALGIYVAFNEWRYHTLTDIGLSLWYYWEPGGAYIHPGLGPFALAYLPFNLFTALFMAPQFVDHFPWVIPTPSGQAILLTSPAFVMAFKAKGRDGCLLWGCLGASMVVAMLVYANGCAQMGFRYLIQGYPFLIALMAIGGVDRVSRCLIVVSIVFVAWGVLALRVAG